MKKKVEAPAPALEQTCRTCRHWRGPGPVGSCRRCPELLVQRSDRCDAWQRWGLGR